MSDVAASIIARTVIIVAGIAAIVLIALFYQGNAEALIVAVISATASIWGSLHTNATVSSVGKTIADDNKQSNQQMANKVEVLADKQDSVNRELAHKIDDASSSVILAVKKG
jgi:hypothetical protein